MKPHSLFRSAAVLLTLASAALAQQLHPPVAVVVSPDATPLEQAAARDLTNALTRVYPSETFRLSSRPVTGGPSILVRTVKPDEPVPAAFGDLQAQGPEAFSIATVGTQGAETVEILGTDSRGTARGAYALLEKLGCGFYLSGDTLPPPRSEPFSVQGWDMRDRPLVRDRLVFNWHNFLSGCSTWNLPEWQAWIRQSQKMGYNAVMVHAYGNNPMASFEFNGRQKPLGYLSTTVKGRDWSTMHVNDVRRLWGGEVFRQPVFGADAALVPDEQRADAARKLMRNVFASAAERAMGVYFAYDVDTASANPQELIETLPPEARFSVNVKAGRGLNQASGRMWLVNPESPEGYRYYKTQVESLLADYPQITCLVVWFRRGATPWTELKVAEMPPAWQKEYSAEIARTPEAAKLWSAPQMFALGKIVRAFDRALKETGRSRVELAAGTWAFDFLAPCDRFFPPQVKLIGLDYNVLLDRPQLGDEESRQMLRDVGAHRPVLPVVWAQHDDGNYLGRSYTPFADFHSKLTDAHACGFGIIHWTTRPLDLFFTSHAKQVWQSTENQPLHVTCDDTAAKWFGPSARAPMAAYLERWVTDAPKFARETSDYFIDRPLTNVEQIVTGCRDRLKLIGAVDQTQLSADARDRVKYFQGLEEFIIAVHQTHAALQRSQALLKSGDAAAAKQALAPCQPEKVIEQFARFSSAGGMTRGEQGLVVTMNLRWLPHFVRQRQALGMEPVRCSFAPTSHDPLAQSQGIFTFHFDSGHQVWECRGEKETGAPVFILPDRVKPVGSAGLPPEDEEICRTGVESDRPIHFLVRPIMAQDSRSQGTPAPLRPGPYRLRLLLLDPTSTAAGQRVFTVDLGGAAGAAAPDRVDIFQETGQANRILVRDYPVTVGAAGEVAVTLAPLQGQAIICGAVLEPGESTPAAK